MNAYPKAAALLCALPLLAQADAPGDYSHAIPLRVSGANALVQVRLPPAVYLNARSAQLNDLRVFDANGKSLPFALLEPAAPARAERRALPAAVFPVHGDSPADEQENVEVRTASGTVISASSKQPGARDRLSALVLDFGQPAAGQAIDALDFTLPPDIANYEAQVALDVSNDLRSWETHAYGRLSWLSNSERQTLSSSRIDFPARAFRYGRLVWREGAPIRFAAVRALAPSVQEVAAPLDRVTLQAQAGRFAHDLVYQTGPAIAAERVGLSFGPGNVVMPAAIGEYVAMPAPRGQSGQRWEFVPRLQATFYQFVQNGAVRRSGDVAAGGMQAALWVVRAQEASSPPPALTLSWRPATLVFLASGSAPYALHVGHARAASSQRTIAEVAPGLSDGELRALEQAALGEVRARTPPALARSAQQAATGRRSHKLALWGVLLLGVAVLGAMVWKLSRQMKETG